MICALDIGGTKIELAVFDSQLTLLETHRVATPIDDYEAFLTAVVNLILTAEKAYQHQALVGVAMAGLIDANGRSLCANVPCANGKMVTRDLESRLQRPIALNNDCRLFALSEAVGGAADKAEVAFGAILGTGAGGGLVINKRLYRSPQGIAGEFGHFQLPAQLAKRYALPSRVCGCGLSNCYERFISGPGLCFLAEHFNLKVSSSRDFFARYRQHDAAAKVAFDCYLDILGACFANIILSYDPEVIVVGGGLSQAAEICDKLTDAIKPHLFAQFQVPAIKRAHFGDSSGVRGAAILASQLP